MKLRGTPILKKSIALMLVVCMLWSLFGQYLPSSVAKAANAKSYTVELNGTTDLFLSNKTASSGPVTLKYTVESVTMATAGSGDNNGVVATTNPGVQYPYTSGSMKYHHLGNYVLLKGCTYTFTMSLDSAGKVTCTTATYTDANGATKNTSIPLTTGNGATASQYFGIYVHPSTTAKLTNVTCTDAKGNDLGLQVNTKNTAKCTIAESAAKPLTSYTVELNGTTDLFLSNKTASSGTVTLSYKVESVTMALAQNGNNNGVVATTTPGAQYPYTSGSMKYHHLGNYVLLEGCTYTFTMSLDSAGKVACTTATYTDVNGATKNVSIPLTAGNGATASQYFGIYVHPSATAKLTNVTCTDAKGNDLGLQVNTKNTAKCTIASSVAGETGGGETGGGETGGGETGGEGSSTDKPLEMTVGDDKNAVKYTIRTGKVNNVFFSNKTATTGIVTLRYTVESADVTMKGSNDNNGVVATTAPAGTHPYTSGSMKYHHVENIMMVEGRTYTVVMRLDKNGKVMYEGSYTDAENTSPVSLGGKLPGKAGNGATDSGHFGVYVSPAMTMKLIDVTCVDEKGNDLGIQINNANAIITTVEAGGQGKTENLDSSYDMITLGNFGIADGTYRGTLQEDGTRKGVIKIGSYPLNMHKKVFSVDIEFSRDAGEDFRYGSQVDGWHGLRFWSDTNCLYMEDVDGNTDRYAFVPLIADATLVGEEFNLKLSTEYVDSDGDGEKDDVKLGVWFNDKLYNNEYIYLKDYKAVLGKYIGVYSANEIAYLTVKSVVGIETGVDYTIFGFTRNWKQELGIK